MKKIILFTTLLFASWSIVKAQSDLIPVGYIHTPLGDLWVELDDRTPEHKKSFIELAKAGYWDSLTFNRVIPNFVAQGGCPDTPAGFTDPNYLLKPEFHPDLTHVYGAIGAGRDDNPGKLSARCQFYIVQNPAGLHRLDGDYTVFGHIIKGMDIVDLLVREARDSKDEPLRPISLKVEIKYLSAKELASLRLP
jgi:peptidyl-prolyl cis-trans isomerase B (cyclophilin B)